MRTFSFLPVLVGAALFAAPTHAQTATTTTTTTTTATTTSATGAVGIARDSVDTTTRDHIVSVYGVGTTAGIQTWWVIFYDPVAASHGRAVKVESGSVSKSYEAKGGVTYAKALTFSTAKVSDEGSALAAAQSYASKNAIAYDQVRVLLRRTNPSDPMRWRVQLLDAATSKGFVFVNATDGTFAMYSPPGSIPSHESAGTGGGVVGDAKRVGNDVKGTFLNIGGDLQQFFTGERTVDQ